MTAEMQSLLDAYDDALHSFHQLAATVHDDQWTLPTDCPGWTVREQVAHVPPRLGSWRQLRHQQRADEHRRRRPTHHLRPWIT